MLIDLDWDNAKYQIDDVLAGKILDTLTYLCNRVEELELENDELQTELDEHVKPWMDMYRNQRPTDLGNSIMGPNP